MVTYDSDEEGARQEALQEAEEEGLYTGGSDVSVEDESDTESGEDSDTGSAVVVPEDPATRDQLKEETGSVAAGTGETVEEAQQDAAESQSFDADPGTDVGEIERKKDLNQPLENPQGSTPEEVQQAAEEIASSDRFRGERTGRQAGKIAQAIQRGQENFDEVDIQTDQDRIQILGRNTKTDTETRPDSTQQNRKVNPWESNEKLTRFGTLIDPTRGNPNATPAEELTTAGVDLMQAGQDVGDAVGRRFPSREDVEEFALTTSRDISKDLGIGNQEERQEFFENAEQFIDQIPETRNPSSLERGVARTGDLIEFGTERVDNQEISQAVTTGDIESLNEIETNEASREDIIDAITISSEEAVQSRKNIVSGASTGGTQLTGLAVSSVGAIPRASATTTQNVLGVDEEDREIAQSSDTGLAEGAAEGVVLTSQEVAKNPDEFVGEEVGEEIGEAAVFGGLTGGAGLAASAVPTPEIEVEPSLDSSKGQTRGIPGVPSERGPGTTPGPGTGRPEVEPETETETETEQLAGTNLRTQFLESARTTPTTLEDSLADSLSQPQSDVLSRPESDIIGEAEVRTETRTEAQPEPDILADAIAETQTETDPIPQIETIPEPELDRTPSGDFGEQDSENGDSGLLSEIFSEQQSRKITSSVGAELLDIEGEKPGEISAQNPLNLRPDFN